MTDERKILPPYKGEEPYIFVSYSHRNSAKVLSVLDRMQKDGYRIWYDEGIDPGTEWDENIADHVEHCGCFVAFLSKEYLQSMNCKDELNYARELDKPRLLVYLEDVELPGGMRMRLGRLQAVHQYKYADRKVFFEKLYEFSSLSDCKAVTAEEPKPAVEPERPKPPVPPVPAQPKPVPPQRPVAPVSPQPKPAAPVFPQPKPAAPVFPQPKPAAKVKKAPRPNLFLMLLGLALAACVVTSAAFLIFEDPGLFLVGVVMTALMGIPSGALIMKGNGKGHTWRGALLFAAFLPLQLGPMLLHVTLTYLMM